MKFKFLLLLLLLPQLGIARCSPSCCTRFQPAGWWGGVDYLLTWRRERFYPPLLTTNPNSNPNLGDPNTTILFGDEFIGKSPYSGWGLTAGIWLTPCFAMGGTLLFPGSEKIIFEMKGDENGNPILGSPFFNTGNGTDSALFISEPGTFIDGFFKADTVNRLFIGDFYGQIRFLGSCCASLDLLAGFMYTNLCDSIDIETSTLNITLADPSRDQRFSLFRCENDYYAGLVGFHTQLHSRNWGVTATGKVGLGNMVKQTFIKGSSVVTNTVTGDVIVRDFSLLTQPSNRGKHSRNQFEIVSQFEADLQLRLFRNLWVKTGYYYMFWPAVALAGEQIDLNVNPTQNPPLLPLVGPLAPLFNLKDKSFWMQGFTAGLYVHY